MRHFKTYIMPSGASEWLDYPILSQKISDYMKNTIAEISDGEVVIGEPLDHAFGNILVCLRPCPCLSTELLGYMTEQTAAVLLTKGTPLAIFGTAEDVVEALAHEDYSSFEPVEAPPGDAFYVLESYGAYLAQESLRERINMRHLKSGVMLMSPQTTFIAPDAIIGKGTTILPGCMINSGTVIGEKCTIGPNTILDNAIVGDGTKLNNVQVQDSTIGKNTSIGPFGWVRPGCNIGDNVRIGDFTEFKKANIGNGTKIAHLTYVGDADLGERINLGCGVVFANYDGKNKYRSTVGDDAFIGCNVNLVSPVNIGSGAYIATGSTITEDVEEGALAIARERMTVKPGWVEKRKAEGKL
ncbi:MAG: hypothetical protein IJC44_01055 [Clostridia bacterium]|nr:hypothetical protein [Clostridia bacterium]